MGGGVWLGGGVGGRIFTENSMEGGCLPGIWGPFTVKERPLFDENAFPNDIAIQVGIAALLFREQKRHIKL